MARPAGGGERQDVSVPGLRPRDPAGHSARGGLAGGRPRRRGRPTALAHGLLAQPGPAEAAEPAVV